MITVHVCINNAEVFCVKAIRIKEKKGIRYYEISTRQGGDFSKWKKRRALQQWNPIYGMLDLARLLLVVSRDEKRYKGENR